MILNVHGTKKTAPDKSANPYAFSSEEPRTRTPLTIAIALGAVVAFVQSLLLSGQAARSNTVFQAEEEDGDPLRPDQLPAEEPEEEDGENGEEEAQQTAQNSSYRLFPIQMDVVESVFARIETPVPPEAPVVLWPANDWFSGFTYVPRPFALKKPSIDALPRVNPIVSQEPDLPAPDNPGPAQREEESRGDGEDDDDTGPDPNRAPRVTGPVYLLDVSICATLVIYLSHLLENAYDPDGDALSITGLTATSGSLRAEAGAWIYEPEAGRMGPVMLNYTITDGDLSVAQVALFSVVPTAPIYGTDGNDILLGGDCADEIHGGDGDDIIDGGGGNDIIYGGNGNDHILGGAGNDIIFGGAGDDIIFGGPGNDTIFGGPGNDRLFGDEGDDTIYGEEGDDFIDGGPGNDILFGGPGNDEIHGGPGDDRIFGDEGDDRLFGGKGNDVIFGGSGNDYIDGGPGDDFLSDGEGNDIVLGGSGDDYVLVSMDGDDDFFDGGRGYDTIDFSQAKQGILIDLVKGTASSAEVGNDTITGFENIIGGAGDDHFIVGQAAVVLTGGEGDNIFEFSAPKPDASADPVLHKIVDFKLGDVIKASKFKIFEKVYDDLEDAFAQFYGQTVEDDDVTIRYRHEGEGRDSRTVIEVEFNADDIFETSIVLQGRHVLLVMEAC